MEHYWTPALQQQLYAFARRQVGFDDALDVVQEVHLRLLNRARYEDIEDVTAFAYRVMRHIVIEWRAQRKRRQLHEFDLDPPLETLIHNTVADPGRSPEGRVANQQLIEYALHKLSGLERQVFVLRYLNDLGRNEIAHHLGISAAGVDRRLASARASVTRSLTGRDFVTGPASVPPAKFNGTLYEITTQIALPETKIITQVAPQIQIASAALAERLKREPQSVYSLEPRQFELLLCELLEDLGYRVDITPATRDGGKDLLAYMDTESGPVLCLVEAKKYQRSHNVGVELVRSLWGAFHDFRADENAQATRAMLVTTSSFTQDAREFQHRHRYQLALKDYGDVERWILQYRTRRH